MRAPEGARSASRAEVPTGVRTVGAHFRTDSESFQLSLATSITIIIIAIILISKSHLSSSAQKCKGVKTK